MSYSPNSANGLPLSAPVAVSSSVSDVQQAPAGKVSVYKAVFCIDDVSSFTPGCYLYLSFTRKLSCLLSHKCIELFFVRNRRR